VIGVAAAVVAAVAAGVLAERRWPSGAERAARFVLGATLYVLLPPATFFLVARLELSLEIGAGLALAWVALILVGGAAWLLSRRVLRLEPPRAGSTINASIHPNTGYLGLPLCAALLGTDALGDAVVFDAFVGAPVLFLGVFAVGAAVGTRAGEGVPARAKSFFLRNPALIAVVAGLLAPEALAPDVAVDAARIAVLGIAPLGFFAVGVTLAVESRGDAGQPGIPFPPPFSAPVGAAIALRLLAAPALLAVLALPFLDLPDAYLVQIAMPCGINSLLAAHAYGLDLGISAGAIAWSTALALLAAVAAGFVL